MMWCGVVWCSKLCWCFRGVFGGAVLMVFRAAVVWCFNVYCAGTGIFVDCFFVLVLLR